MARRASGTNALGLAAGKRVDGVEDRYTPVPGMAGTQWREDEPFRSGVSPRILMALVQAPKNPGGSAELGWRRRDGHADAPRVAAAFPRRAYQLSHQALSQAGLRGNAVG